MEPISSWSADTVRGYLEGLDPSVQHYPFQEWDITGQDLLDLSPQHLDVLGVRSIGHQEIILEAVEQLCSLHYELHSDCLRTLTDKLYGVAQMLSAHILTLRKVPLVSKTSALSPTHKQLACIIDIVSAARGLFSWLNRYLFTRLNDYSACRDVIALCVELADMLHKDWAVPQIENRILTICENICEICKSILSCSPENLLNQTATLEPVQINPEPSQSLGIEIKSTSSGQHFVCLTAAESPARRCGQIQQGDEIVKVNDRIVVGWTQKNLVLKLQERSNFVTLVLKKVSIFPSKTPVSPNIKRVHGAFTSVSAHSAPVSPAVSDILASASEPNAGPLLKSNSVPNLLVKHKNLLPTQSAPTILILNCLPVLKPESGDCISLKLSETVSSYTENFSEEKQNQPSEFSSQMHNTWPYPGTPSHCKPQVHASSVFPSSISTCSSDLSTLQNMSSSTIYAKTLTPITQFSPVPQDLKYNSRPRSGSASSTTSLLTVPLSSEVLRPSISDSNLVTPTNSAVIPKCQVQEGLEGFHKSLEEAMVCSRDPHTDKTPQSSQINNRPKNDKEVTAGSCQKQNRVTKLSRRRISCRDLGSPDCDGWLWKRKENVGFMSQKWKRCWCALKRDRFYWYNAPQDEKALGLINVSLYKLESPLEAKHKKKYEFQLTHPTYKTFVFAADNLTEMKKWVTCLIKTLQKFKAPTNSSHSKEEDCYSETEAEDDDQFKTPVMLKKQLVQSPTKNMSEARLASACEEEAEGAQLPKSSNAQCQVDDDLQIMMSCLKQGGVSLIGKKTAMTHDEYRKSFIRRNKNPDINHKAHTLRVMQSTLKAKLLELQALDQILENPNLTSATFKKWKSEHEQIYGSLDKSPQAARKIVRDMYQKGITDNFENKQNSGETDSSD